MTEPRFDPEAILAALDRHGVDYVLVGGYAANVHGARRPTRDIDVTPATTRRNLTRLVAALRELEAGIRVDNVPPGLPFATSPDALRGVTMLNLRTPVGDIDLTFAPAAFPGGYDDLIDHAQVHVVDGVTVHVAALTDIIASKTAAARQKDFDALPELRALATKLSRAGEAGPASGSR